MTIKYYMATEDIEYKKIIKIELSENQMIHIGIILKQIYEIDKRYQYLKINAEMQKLIQWIEKYTE